MEKSIIVIGAGTAGMETAGRLASDGFKVRIIEKDSKIGGHLNNWYHLFPNRRDSVEVLEYLNGLVKDKRVEIITDMTVTKITRERDRFTVVTSGNKEFISDAVVVTTGFDLFDSKRKEEYGYGIYNNIITSADLEKMFREGTIKCRNGKSPHKIGFIHCVGSRDEKVGNNFCSKLCCVTAVKQAIEVKRLIPDSKVFCFYMDIRMGGAGYEELYRESQQKHGINYIRGKVSEVSANLEGKLVVKAEDTLISRPLKMELDMLVLMVGMEMSQAGGYLASNSNLKLGDNRFFAPADHHFGSNRGNIDGLFYAGACTAPMTVTETISHARAAVDEVIDFFNRD